METLLLAMLLLGLNTRRNFKINQDKSGKISCKKLSTLPSLAIDIAVFGLIDGLPNRRENYTCFKLDF